MENDARNKLLARALRTLRLDRDLTLQFIADRLKKVKQTISQWESGNVVLKDSILDEYLGAISATRDDLEAKAESLGAQIGAVISFDTQPWYRAYPETLGELILNTDDLAPWAERGEKVLYERDRHPLREQACVVETKDGRTLPRFFVKSEAGRAYFRTNLSDKLEDYLWDEVQGVHRIVLRGS